MKVNRIALIGVATAFLILFCIPKTIAKRGMKNLGMVGIKSVAGNYLQAHADNGEMHASNGSRNEEETWFLIEIDKRHHIYGIQNWKNGRYMTHSVNGCAPASNTTLGNTEKWVLVSGHRFGVENAVAIKSLNGGLFLNGGTNDTSCGGEVALQNASGPSSNSSWQGWWVLEPAQTPTPGSNLWNTVGGIFQGIANVIEPVAVDALLAALSAS